MRNGNYGNVLAFNEESLPSLSHRARLLSSREIHIVGLKQWRYIGM